jgi:hypothetical protein
VSEKPIGRLRRFALVTAAYLFLSVVWLYGFVDQGRLEGSDWRTWSLVVLVFALHAAFGWAIREWAALLLPIAVVFLAIPAGYPESQFSEPLPVWLGQIFYVVIEIPAIACGLALRTLYDCWRRTPWPSR